MMAALKGSENGETVFPRIHTTKADKTIELHHEHIIQGSNLSNSTPVHISPPQASEERSKDVSPIPAQPLEVVSEDFHAVAFFFWPLAALVAVFTAFITLSWSWFTALTAVFIGFVIFRHVTLKWERPQLSTGRGSSNFGGVTNQHKRTPSSPVPDTSRLPAVYFLYVLGSGGHSAEMIEMIKRNFRGQPNQHRRYVITSGDTSSQHMAEKLEALVSAAYPSVPSSPGTGAGTSDAFRIRRARDIHQPLLTAPLTCLVSASHAVGALTRPPAARSATRHGHQFRYPHVIVTNGPATGFIVCAVAHLLKIFYLVPQNRLRMVYVETWARSRSLSLTGKLFLWSGIADMFCVQHEGLARGTRGAEFVGGVSVSGLPTTGGSSTTVR